MNKKADTTDADKAPQSDDEKRQQVYQISANRGRAKHKMRYVERSLEDTGDCRLCVGAISPEDDDTEQS
ncbi:MAG: hypothetical protein GYB30_08075 [Gammaproteobacteria bacterium]|jgi:hypothetical protein|nr:hypothetical protein [Gammaproteobacteria bacterium]